VKPVGLATHSDRRHDPSQGLFELWMGMQGGDLMDAIALDRKNMLRWSRKGSLLALDIAKGLVHLHTHKVLRLACTQHNPLVSTCCF